MADDKTSTISTRNYESAFIGNKPGVFVGRYGEPAPAPTQNLTPDLRNKPELTPP